MYSWPAVLWVWDQCALSGWEVMAEIAADCLWLLRHKISRLDGLQVMIILTIVVYNIYMFKYSN